MNISKYLAVFALSASLQAVHAATLTVGSCQLSLISYPTISAAIAHSHAGDTISVCPGTYPEQLVITRAITIRGLVISDQSGVAITVPPAGLKEYPAKTAFYPQVYVNQAGGLVTLSNLAIKGASASILYNNIALDTTSACQVGLMKDFSGIYFQNTPGYVNMVSISGHFVTSVSPDNPGPQQFPNCGTGVVFNNPGMQSTVADSVVDGFGYTGISANSALTASHNVLMSPSGPYQVGISAPTTSTLTSNTITGVAFPNNVGIQGGATVTDNIVEGFSLGIGGAQHVEHNTLLDNNIGIQTPLEATTNVITTSQARYLDPSCADGSCQPTPIYDSTIGIDMQCADSSMVTSNGVVGAGIGFANVKAGQNISTTNLFAEVGTTTTSCAQNSTNGQDAVKQLLGVL